MMESLTPEKRRKSEFCLRFLSSYHVLRASRFLSVPENTNCMLKLQSESPPWLLHLEFGIAQSWLLRHTEAPPEHLSQLNFFQCKFCKIPLWNSSTWKKKNVAGWNRKENCYLINWLSTRECRCHRWDSDSLSMVIVSAGHEYELFGQMGFCFS